MQYVLCPTAVKLLTYLNQISLNFTLREVLSLNILSCTCESRRNAHFDLRVGYIHESRPKFLGLLSIGVLNVAETLKGTPFTQTVSIAKT
jgi:hypothetical protein